MKTLQEIKDEYARQVLKKDWDDLTFLHAVDPVSLHEFDEIATRYAAEIAKGFAEWLDKNDFHINKWGDWENGKRCHSTETAYNIFIHENT